MKKKFILLSTFLLLFLFITTGCKIQSVEEYHGIEDQVIDSDKDSTNDDSPDEEEDKNSLEKEDPSLNKEQSMDSDPSIDKDVTGDEDKDGDKKETSDSTKSQGDNVGEGEASNKKEGDKPKENTAHEKKPSASSQTSSQETKADDNKDTNKKNNNKKPENEATPSKDKETVESTEPAKDKAKEYVTIGIACNMILNNYDQLDSALQNEKFVPSDGVILKKSQFPFEEGESVFDILVKATRKHRIHMEYQGADQNQYGSVYVQGINNLYEFSCGNLSGWMYNVNGTYPNVGASVYKVKAGDHIQWNYTCDLGRDLGVDWLDK